MLQMILKMAERYRLTRRRVRPILEQEEHMHSHVVNDPNPPIQVSEPHKLSEVNKKNRAKQQLISTTGPKSVAKRQHDYEEKMGQQMSLIQTFKMMYTKKNGEPSTSVAAEKFVNHECEHVSNEKSNEENDVFHSLNGRSSVGSCVFPSHELMRRGHSYATVDDLVNEEKLLKSGDDEMVVEGWR
ncbi:hypothetical protein Taro_031884 [Colocasia esculenta]|uniref:Uncharacterized protein n=1 Tax=Colocasia esculenta TaxID=4460 RepID=A0A843W4G2_COLES|nr:hypothetical protein [Colocasia esculenta]